MFEIEGKQLTEISSCVGFVEGVLMGIQYEELSAGAYDAIETCQTKLKEISLIINEVIENA